MKTFLICLLMVFGMSAVSFAKSEKSGSQLGEKDTVSCHACVERKAAAEREKQWVQETQKDKSSSEGK